jgi:uncharacterized protein (DUF427 family)
MRTSTPLPTWAELGRQGWQHRGEARPPFAVTPGPGQESVWDYPRPPVTVADAREVVVALAGVEVARTSGAIRMLETSHPPTFYLPRQDVQMGLLSAVAGASGCEWKGVATFFDVVVGSAGTRRARRAAWSYQSPFDGADAIAGHIAFYAGLVDATVDGVRVVPQEGGFYGGWITPELVGPFKGGSGSSGW